MEDYASEADQEALEILKATGPLPFLAKTLIVEPRMRRLKASLSAHAIHISRIQELDAIMRECAENLCLDFLPAVYIQDLGRPNAFTFGTDAEPIIVLDNRLLRLLVRGEWLALLGHEMGHVKTQHLIYHSLAEILIEGAGFSASVLGFGFVTTPIRLALLAWHRESELSADRAALIASSEVRHVASMFAKILGIPTATLMNGPSLSDTFFEAFQSHPMHANRIRALIDFSRSREFAMVTKKIERRRMLKAALMSSCKFCGAPKPVRAPFCPSCQRSQV
jgi:Zn-dependent protease with chaperone function